MNPSRVLAQVVFADVRAPGPITPSIGWKVTEVEVADGSIEPDRDLLLAVDAVGQAYSPDVELAVVGRSAEVPTVLKQVRLRGDVVILASFADAGLDRTGRASHVVHGLLHEGALVGPGRRALRPIELLDSPMWVRPVGEAEVSTTSVKGAAFDLPPGPVDLDHLVGDGFLTDLDHAGRVELLPVVLAAFAEALARDRYLLLAVPDRDEVVGWLGLLQGLLDPVSAGALRFSVREEVRSAAAVDRFDLQIAGVVVRATAAGGATTDSRLAGLGDAFLLVDTVAACPPVSGTGGWELPIGGDLPSHAWADIAQTVLGSALTAGDVRASLDQLAELMPDAVGRSPLWGLPVAALLSGVAVDDPVAQLRLLLQDWPDRGAVDARVVSAVRDLYLQETGGDPTLAASLAPHLGAAVPADFVRGPVLDWYRAALGEPGAPRGDAPPPRGLPADAVADLVAGLPALVAWLPDAPPVQQWPAAERSWRLATAAGVAEDVVADLLGRVGDAMVALLVDPAFDPFAAGWRPVPEPLWRRVLAPRLTAALDAGASAPSAATLAWSAPVVAEADRPEVAAQLRPPRLTTYGAVLAASLAPGPDDALTAVTVMGRAAENLRTGGQDPRTALVFAIGQVFGGSPLPFAVADRLRDGVDADTVALVTARALAGAGPGPGTRSFARAAWEQLVPAGGFSDRPEASLLAAAVHWRELVTGAPEAAGRLLPEVTDLLDLGARHPLPPAWAEPTRTAVRVWVLRLSPAWLGDRAPDGFATQGRAVARSLGTLVTTRDELVDAWALLTAQNDAETALRALAGLAVRAVVADIVDGGVEDEPFGALLLTPGEDQTLIRDLLDDWIDRTDDPVPLRAATQEVLGDLVTAGWSEADVQGIGDAVDQLIEPPGRTWLRGVGRGVRK